MVVGGQDKWIALCTDEHSDVNLDILLFPVMTGVGFQVRLMWGSMLILPVVLYGCET